MTEKNISVMTMKRFTHGIELQYQDQKDQTDGNDKCCSQEMPVFLFPAHFARLV